MPILILRTFRRAVRNPFSRQIPAPFGEGRAPRSGARGPAKQKRLCPSVFECKLLILNRSLRSLCGLLAAPRRLGRRLLADSLARLLILSRALSRAVRTSQTPLLAPPSAALVCATPSVRRTRAPCLAPRSRSDSPRPFIDMGEDAGQSRTMRDHSGSCAVGGVRPVRTDFLTQLADVLLPHVKTLRPEALRGEWGELDMYIEEGV